MRVGVTLLALLLSTPAFAESTNSCADASERAQKLVDERRLLEAKAAFRSCAQSACPAAISNDCQGRLEEMKKTLPSIVVSVKGKDGDVAGGVVTLDGANIGVVDGQSVDVDPGTHKIHVQLPDGRTFDRQVILAPGDHSRPVTFDTQQTQTQTSTQAQTHWTTMRTAGFITLVIGATAFAVGFASQILALTEQNNATTLQSRANAEESGSCPSLSSISANSDCESAISFHNQANASQSAALGLFVTGGVVAITGVILFVVGGNERTHVAIHPLIGPTFAGLGISSAF
jgi:hypothetical protein